VALAANALDLVGSDANKAEYLPGIASGDTIATLALTDDAGDWNLATTSTTARTSGDGWVVDGGAQLRHRRQRGCADPGARDDGQGSLALRAEGWTPRA